MPSFKTCFYRGIYFQHLGLIGHPQNVTCPSLPGFGWSPDEFAALSHEGSHADALANLKAKPDCLLVCCFAVGQGPSGCASLLLDIFRLPGATSAQAPASAAQGLH